MAEGLSSKTDWNHAAGDYAKHRAGFPDWFFDRIAAAGLFRPGMRVLDLATGTGTLARGFAKRGGIVTGLDIAREMMAQAKALDAAAEVTVDYVTAKAEATGLPDAHFDLVTAGTCWFWFDGDLAAAEAGRVLKPGGHLMIAMLAWLPLKGSVDYDIPYSHEAWRGRIRASAGVSASLGPEAVAAFDAEHALMLSRDFPSDPMQVPHRVVASWGRNSA
jgi:SAM-dependent methyltransferase